MVGVASSKLCFNCLHRRKKCDGRRPGCSQCQLRSEACPGYKARFRFVSHTGAKLPYPTIEKDGQELDDAGNPLGYDPAATLQLLPRNLVGTAKGIELLCRFDEIYKPRRKSSWKPLATDLSNLPSWEWVLTVFESSQIEPLLNDVVRALVLSSVGRCDQNEVYVQRGAELHARAVNTLKVRLKSERECCSDHTLAAVMVFGMYEIQIGSATRGNAWLAHVTGFETLLKMRAHSDQPIPMFVKKLIWASQYHRWVIAMRGRGKPGTAAAPVLFDLLEDGAPPDVRLFALLHDIAPLCAKVDQFSTFVDSCDDHQKAQIGLALLSELYEMESQLRAWPDTLEASGPLHWDEDSTLYSAYSPFTNLSKVFEKAVCFRSVRVAISMLFCWTGLLFVSMLKEMINIHRTASNWAESILTEHQEWYEANSNISPTESITELSWLASDQTESEPESSYTVAICVMRSLEYFLHPDMGQLGTYLIGFPLGVCQSYFERRKMQEELLWLKVVHARMAESGSGLGDFLRELRGIGSSITAG